MKIILQLIFFLSIYFSFPFSCFSQTFDLLITTNYNEESFSAIETDEGDFIVGIINNSHFGSPANYNSKLLKINSEGVIIDSLSIELPGHFTYISGIVQLNSNQFFVFGDVKDETGGYRKPFISAYDKNLNQFFFHFYDSIVSVGFIDHCIINNAGNLFCVGKTNVYSNSDMFLWELDDNGIILKSNIKTPDKGTPYFRIVELPSINGYHIIELYANTISRFNYNLQFENLEFSELTADFGMMDAKLLSDSTYIVTGELDRYEPTKYPPFLESLGFKIIDRDFQKLDSVNYIRLDTNDHISFNNIDFKNKDSIFIGFSKNYMITWDLGFEKTNSWFGLNNMKQNGSLNWQKFYGGDCQYVLKKVLATNDGGALLIGQRWDWKVNPDFEKDVYIIKIDREGNFVPKVGIGINEQKMQAKTVLVYPNPAKDKINIQTGLMRDLHFQLFDARGRLLIEKSLNSSSESIDISTLPGGIYFYKTEGKNGFYESGKIVKE